MTNSEYCKHTPPLFKSLIIFNLTDLPRYNVASYMYTQVRSNTYNIQPLHSYATRNQRSLRTPRHKLTLFRQSLKYLGPKIWNDVPSSMKYLIYIKKNI